MRVRLVDDPRAEVGEDVRVGVGVRVGLVEFPLIVRRCAGVEQVSLDSRKRRRGSSLLAARPGDCRSQRDRADGIKRPPNHLPCLQRIRHRYHADRHA